MSARLSPAAVECVLDARADVGEGATWCPESQRLLWVDVWRQRVHRFDPASGIDEHFSMPERAGCVAPAGPDLLVVGLQSGLFSFVPSSGSLQPLAALAHAGENRCNDSVVDRAGRLWCGTMPMQGLKAGGGPSGELFSFGGGRLRLHLGELYLSNGLACSPDGKLLYLSDSHPSRNRVWVFDLDQDGTLSGQRLFLDGVSMPGRPDGATVDADGCYWICAIDGWSVLRVTPRGQIDRVVMLPVSKPSKVAIGGRHLDTLLITSISATLDEQQRAGQPLAGGVFAVHVGSLGVAGVPVDLSSGAVAHPS